VPGEPDGELVLTSRKSEAVAGEFRRAGSWVRFKSNVGKEGDVAVQVEVNGHTLDATYTATSNLVKLDGHGYALSAEDKVTLIALAHEFERAGIGAQEPGSTIPASEFWLYRSVNLWSEAPVGYPLAPSVVSVPKASAGGPEALGATSGGPAIGWDFVYHTGSDGHWVNAAASTGPCEKDCVGRCGAGCPMFGGAVYYWACASHDMCCGAHGGCFNPFDSNCGDEYSQAKQGYTMRDNYSSCSSYSNVAPYPGWSLSQVRRRHALLCVLSLEREVGERQRLLRHRLEPLVSLRVLSGGSGGVQLHGLDVVARARVLGDRHANRGVVHRPEHLELRAVLVQIVRLSGASIKEATTSASTVDLRARPQVHRSSPWDDGGRSGRQPCLSCLCSAC
jgi:hypothetical protein